MSSPISRPASAEPLRLFGKCAGDDEHFVGGRARLDGVGRQERLLRGIFAELGEGGGDAHTGDPSGPFAASEPRQPLAHELAVGSELLDDLWHRANLSGRERVDPTKGGSDTLFKANARFIEEVSQRREADQRGGGRRINQDAVSLRPAENTLPKRLAVGRDGLVGQEPPDLLGQL